MALLEHALDDANLFAAWDKVRRNRGAAGSDGQTVDQFSVNAFGRLLTLKQQAMRGQYPPEPGAGTPAAREERLGDLLADGGPGLCRGKDPQHPGGAQAFSAPPSR